MISVQDKIITQACSIVGSSQYAVNTGHKADSVERLCGVFVDAAIEEVYLAINWAKGIRKIPPTEGSVDKFTQVLLPQLEYLGSRGMEKIDDGAVKIISIAPSNFEWYIDNEQIYFKSEKLENGFYYSTGVLDRVLNESRVNMPNMFAVLCAMFLSANVAQAIYANSEFTEGLRVNYLTALEETKKVHQFDYHLFNSARFA